MRREYYCRRNLHQKGRTQRKGSAERGASAERKEDIDPKWEESAKSDISSSFMLLSISRTEYDCGSAKPTQKYSVNIDLEWY